MLKENLKDAGEIIQNILTQPLSIPGLADNITLLSAAQNFRTIDGANSELSKVLQTFLDYPEPTQVLIRELELIYQDINV